MDDIDGRAAGAGGAPIEEAGLEWLPQWGLLLLEMIEFKCIEDLLDSESSLSDDFLNSILHIVDSISIVVSGPVPREH